MNRLGRLSLLGAIVVGSAAAVPASAGQQDFELARYVPDDVFLFVSGRSNPEMEFVDQYWSEVFEALKQSGVGNDLLSLLGSMLGEDGVAEFERLRNRAEQLIAGVDWDQICNVEVAFVERLAPPIQAPERGGVIFAPHLAGIFRGTTESAEHNYAGLVAMVRAVVEEINRAAGAEVMSVQMSNRAGAEVASVNLLEALPGVPSLPLAVSRHDRTVMVSLGDKLRNEILDMLGGVGGPRALADDPRYRSAFKQLPEPEDAVTFFNTQGLLKPLREVTNLVVAQISEPGGVFHNTDMNEGAETYHSAALAAYRRHDYAEALRQTRLAHEQDPDNAIILYNLGCFNALTGKKQEALDWLEKAVRAGFCAPQKISADSDFESLRQEPRFQAAVAEAGRLAREFSAEDVVINSTKEGEAHKYCTDAWRCYDQKDYEGGLRLVEQAYEIAPNDSRVLYYLSCFHALLGHHDRALTYLEKSVDGGFYCPMHISSDPDLESIRSNPRYESALARAKVKAAEASAKQVANKLALAKGLLDRLMDTVGILDYVAGVQYTDGHDSFMDTLAVLVPDASSRPLYPVFGGRKNIENFERFLPRETLSFSVCSGIDFGELYRYFEDSLRVAGPMGEELLGKWNALQGKMNFEIKEDLLSWIEGSGVSVTLEDGGSWILLLKVTDEERARQKFSAALDLLSAKIAESAAEIPPLAMLTIRRSPVLDEQLAGFENLHLAVSPVPVVWGVAEGHVIVGSSADAVGLCLATARGAHPNIRDNPRIMSELLLPGGSYASISLTDYRKLGEELAILTGSMSMAGGMMGMFIPDPEAQAVIGKLAGIVAKLGPVVRKIDFFESTASTTTFDGRQWHTRAVTHYVAPEEHKKKVPPPPAKDTKRSTDGL